MYVCMCVVRYMLIVAVVMAKKESLPTEQSREKLRDLRKKAMDREQEEQTNSFSSHEVLVKYDPRTLDVSTGAL